MGLKRPGRYRRQGCRSAGSGAEAGRQHTVWLLLPGSTVLGAAEERGHCLTEKGKAGGVPGLSLGFTFRQVPRPPPAGGKILLCVWQPDPAHPRLVAAQVTASRGGTSAAASPQTGTPAHPRPASSTLGNPRPARCLPHARPPRPSVPPGPASRSLLPTALTLTCLAPAAALHRRRPTGPAATAPAPSTGDRSLRRLRLLHITRKGRATDAAVAQKAPWASE